MARLGKCTNYPGCLLAGRNELIPVADGAPLACPECQHPLIDAGRPGGRKPMAVPIIILGGISLMVIMGAGAVYIQVRRLNLEQPSGQIGTSFEQSEIAGNLHQFLPSRHMETVETRAPVAVAYSQCPAGERLAEVQVQLGLDSYEVRYRSGLPDGLMSMVYFLPAGNLHIDARKAGDDWVILNVPLLEPSTVPPADRVAEWDRAADSQNRPSASQR